MADRLATVHVRLPDGSLMPFPLPVSGQDAHQGGGAGLFATMSDYGRFIRMILNDGELDGERVLSARTIEQMVVNQMGDLHVEPMVSAMPQFTNDAEFFPGQKKSWGMSFQINDEPAPTGRPAGGLMWAGLANSYFWIDRSTGIAGTYLTQILPFVDPGSFELFTEFETAVYAAR
jgi:methyl acetate hydrolase